MNEYRKQIEVVLDPAQVPEHLATRIEHWYGNVLRLAGVPLFGRALAEDVSKGTLARTQLESGRVKFVWTDEGAIA